tara:strand:+ start:617 stop:988 length:372 start_codon:yes stop_codon:yes gene_type:complete
MALQGKLTWKGIDLEEAYIAMQTASCSVNYQSEQVEKTAATYNEDGTVKSEAVYEEQINKILNGNFAAAIYKDKATKDANPNNPLDVVYGVYTPKHTTSAKNDVAQAYAALKAMDAYKDLADA